MCRGALGRERLPNRRANPRTKRPWPSPPPDWPMSPFSTNSASWLSCPGSSSDLADSIKLGWGRKVWAWFGQRWAGFGHISGSEPNQPRVESIRATLGWTNVGADSSSPPACVAQSAAEFSQVGSARQSTCNRWWRDFNGRVEDGLASHNKLRRAAAGDHCCKPWGPFHVLDGLHGPGTVGREALKCLGTKRPSSPKGRKGCPCVLNFTFVCKVHLVWRRT